MRINGHQPASLVSMIAASYDVVVIGAGVAGLSAARALNGHRVLVLEAGVEVGGRTRVDVIAGENASMGAGVVYRGTPTDATVAELGIDTFPVAPDTYSIHWRGVTVVARTLGELVAGLPLDRADRADLLSALRKISLEYDDYSGHGLKGEADELADVSFSEYIGQFRPLVAEILDDLVFAHAMVRAHEISAKYVLRYLSSKLVMDASHAGFIRKGMQQIAFSLSDQVAADIALDHTVTSILGDGDGYRVTVESPTGRRSVIAREVIVAVPGPAVRALIPELPEWKVRALDSIESVSALVVGVTLAPVPDAPWRNVFFVPVIDGAFDYVCTMRVGPDQDKDAPNTWQLGMWRERARAEMEDSDSAIAERWIDGLDAVFPGAKDAVLGWSVARWPAGFAIAKSDRRAVLPDAIRAVEGIHFAGDWASESAGTHGSIESGCRAADEVRARLTPLATR